VHEILGARIHVGAHVEQQRERVCVVRTRECGIDGREGGAADSRDAGNGVRRVKQGRPGVPRRHEGVGPPLGDRRRGDRQGTLDAPRRASGVFAHRDDVGCVQQLDSAEVGPGAVEQFSEQRLVATQQQPDPGGARDCGRGLRDRLGREVSAHPVECDDPVVACVRVCGHPRRIPDARRAERRAIAWDVTTSAGLLTAARRLARDVEPLRFAPPVTHVYNPLVYAWRPHRAYVRAYGATRKRVVFLGMNPGPYGMAQTGVAFGEVNRVRDWLGAFATGWESKRRSTRRNADIRSGRFAGSAARVAR
jgi:hypothetical protein